MRAIIFYFNLLPVTSHNWSKRFHRHQEFSHLYRLNIHVYLQYFKEKLLRWHYQSHYTILKTLKIVS